MFVILYTVHACTNSIFVVAWESNSSFVLRTSTLSLYVSLLTNICIPPMGRSIEPWLQRKVDAWHSGDRQLLQSPEDRAKVRTLIILLFIH